MAIIIVFQENIKSDNDIKSLTGTLKNHEHITGHRGINYYLIWIEETNSPLKIGASFMSIFDKSGFETNALKYSKIKFSVYNNIKLNENNNSIFIYSLSINNSTYLSLNSTINSLNKFLIYQIIIIIICSIVSAIKYFYRRKETK